MLALTLACVGRSKAGGERDLAKRYLDRAVATGRGVGLSIALREISESRAKRAMDRKCEEAEAILAAAVNSDTSLVVFDATGDPMDSQCFAGIIRQALNEGRPMTFVIGGPDGLGDKLRQSATHIIALGAMTWPHQLARIMVTEQIYRAITILAGHPYHRA